MKKNEMFSERDTLEEAHTFATDIALSLDKSDAIPVLTGINVLTNTSIKLLEEKEAARKVKVSFQIQPTEKPLPSGTYHAKLVEGVEPLDSRLREDFNIEGTTTGRTYGAYTDSVASENVLLRDKIDKLVRQVEKQSDLRFILFTLEHMLDRSSS